MERFSINLGNLPQSKQGFLKQYLEEKSIKERKFFIVGLILFGFCSVLNSKSKDSFKNFNMQKATGDFEKFRISIDNDVFLESLSKFETQKEKLSMVYYFLFCGICRLSDLIQTTEIPTKKDYEKIEIDLFFSGLSNYVDLENKNIANKVAIVVKKTKKDSSVNNDGNGTKAKPDVAIESKNAIIEDTSASQVIKTKPDVAIESKNAIIEDTSASQVIETKSEVAIESKNIIIEDRNASQVIRNESDVVVNTQNTNIALDSILEKTDAEDLISPNMFNVDVG